MKCSKASWWKERKGTSMPRTGQSMIASNVTNATEIRSLAQDIIVAIQIAGTTMIYVRIVSAKLIIHMNSKKCVTILQGWKCSKSKTECQNFSSPCTKSADERITIILCLFYTTLFQLLTNKIISKITNERFNLFWSKFKNKYYCLERLKTLLTLLIRKYLYF